MQADETGFVFRRRVKAPARGSCEACELQRRTDEEGSAMTPGLWAKTGNTPEGAQMAATRHCHRLTNSLS